MEIANLVTEPETDQFPDSTSKVTSIYKSSSFFLKFPGDCYDLKWFMPSKIQYSKPNRMKLALFDSKNNCGRSMTGQYLTKNTEPQCYIL